MVEAIRSGGHDCEFMEGNLTLVEKLPKYKADICFNICEGYYGDSREAQVPALLEMLRIPYTGSRVLALALAPVLAPMFVLFCETFLLFPADFFLVAFFLLGPLVSL